MYNPYDTEKYPKRKNPRLKGYDYSKTNYYFVTICTHNKQFLFGKIGENTEEKKIAETGILEIPIHYPEVRIEHYAVMPNHVHILLYLSDGKNSMDQIIGKYKAHVTRQIHKIHPDLKIWQDSFHDHIIRDEKGFQKIWLYIDSNPMNWEKDCFYSK
ncbi:MAG: transposase [Oscillospiraceae bacterium]|nr:transposase [Oscillospiraceae bacterium]